MPPFTNPVWFRELHDQASVVLTLTQAPDVPNPTVLLARAKSLSGNQLSCYAEDVRGEVVGRSTRDSTSVED